MPLVLSYPKCAMTINGIPLRTSAKALPRERNYDIYDKEMLAVMRALEQWRHYLEGATHPVQVLTDHKNLEYFMTAQKLNRRQARWSVFLSRFDLNLQHRPGKSSANPISCRVVQDHKTGIEHDNENQVLLKPSFFGPKIAILLLLISFQHIKQAQRDEDFWQSWDKLDADERKTSVFAGWTEDEGKVLMKNGKVWVPEKCRVEVLKACHDSTVVGHPGQRKTEEIVKRTFWFEGLHQYVLDYVKGCQHANAQRSIPQNRVEN